jgi:hypothetical protein
MSGEHSFEDRLTVRKTRFSKALFVLVACWPLSKAGAATLDGFVLPDTYRVDDQTLTLNGIGLRTLTIFHIKAYVAGLYVRQPSHDPQQILASPGIKVLVLKFVHGASKERVERQYRAGEQDNCGSGGCDPKDAPDFEHLVAVAPAVEPGDTTTYIIDGNYVRVFANDRLIDEFRNRDLAYQLLAGFIGDHPPTPSLRRQLLGLPEE